jgi:Uncharacterized protein conserved in bacteria
MLAHLSALAGFIIPLGTFLGPFIVWQIKKNEMPSVVPHAKAALNFQLSCLLYAIVSAILIVVLVGLFLLFAVGIFSLVCTIIAAIKANNGEPWKYPLSLNLIK